MGHKDNHPAVINKMNKGSDQVFHFNKMHNYTFNFSDFENSKLSGYLSKTSFLTNKNFLSCQLSELILKDHDLNSCDFLDSSIIATDFKNCSMKGTHFNTCHLSDCQFENCKMEWTNHNESVFQNCTFINCSFENILIKNCEFINCKFIEGTTTNKLFESCLLLSCEFESISLQIQTISDNIGLFQDQFKNVDFRTARYRDEHKVFSLSNIHSAQPKYEMDYLSLFSWQYFLFGMTKETYETIFQLASNYDWLRHKVTSTLIIRTENFVSFLQFLYDKNQIILLPLIRLRDFFEETTSYLSKNHNFQQRSVLRSFEGLLLSLSRYVGAFLDHVSQLSTIFSIETIYLDATGPNDVTFFEDLFSHLIDRNLIEIKSVRIRNSPVEVAVGLVEVGSIWFFTAMLLAIRFKYECEHIAPDKLKRISKDKKNIKIRKTKSLIEFGPLKTEDKDIGIQYLSVFSNGISKKLILGFSAQRALRIQKHIIGLFRNKPHDS